MMKYDEIVEQLLSDEELMQYTLEGMIMSPLCIGKIGNEPADCFLTMVSNKQDMDSILWKLKVIIREDGQTDREIEECYDSLSEEPDTSEMTNENISVEKYMELYSEIKEFAFRDVINLKQKSILKEFMQCWNIMEKGLKTKMEEYFPEFFQWVKNVE